MLKRTLFLLWNVHNTQKYSINYHKPGTYEYSYGCAGTHASRASRSDENENAVGIPEFISTAGICGLAFKPDIGEASRDATNYKIPTSTKFSLKAQGLVQMGTWRIDGHVASKFWDIVNFLKCSQCTKDWALRVNNLYFLCLPSISSHGLFRIPEVG